MASSIMLVSNARVKPYLFSAKMKLYASELLECVVNIEAKCLYDFNAPVEKYCKFQYVDENDATIVLSFFLYKLHIFTK